MTTTPILHATRDDLARAIQLARSPHLFLSIYLPTEPAQTSTEGIRLRVSAMLNQLATDLAGTPLEQPFAEEREAVEGFMRSLRPGGPGLAILSSQSAHEWEARWLPEPVKEHVRFGPGAYVLPLIDLMNRWAPVGLAIVARDQVRLMVLEGDQIETESLLEAEVPGQHRAGGGTGSHYRGGAPAYASQRQSSGGASARFQRHIQAHVDRLYDQSLQELRELHQQHGFRHLFLVGPTESSAQFKSQLPQPLKGLLAGDLALDARASDREIAHQVKQAVEQARLREELDLVNEVITRSEKDQGAVTGAAPTLWAINRHQMHLLLLAAESPGLGGYCANCELMLPPEDVVCPQCDEKPRSVNLWEELPGFAMGRGVRIEVVHGEAASLLWHHQSMGGLLKPERH
jgi:peptide chain release factor subunit 1